MLKRRNTPSIEFNLIPIPGSQILGPFLSGDRFRNIKISYQSNLKPQARFLFPACVRCSYRKRELCALYRTIQLTAEVSADR